MRFRFYPRAFGIFLALFMVEILIGLYVRDRFVRPYLGDVLVVLLIYYFFHAFIGTDRRLLILAVLLFACAVETAQYFHLVNRLGLAQSRFWTIVIGNSFSWADLIAYTAGAALLWLITAGRKERR